MRVENEGVKFKHSYIATDNILILQKCNKEKVFFLADPSTNKQTRNLLVLASWAKELSSPSKMCGIKSKKKIIVKKEREKPNLCFLLNCTVYLTFSESVMNIAESK